MVRAVSQAWHRLCSSWEETQYLHLLTQCMPKTKPDGSGEKAFKQPQRIVWNYWVTPSCGLSSQRHWTPLQSETPGSPAYISSFFPSRLCLWVRVAPHTRWPKGWSPAHKIPMQWKQFWCFSLPRLAIRTPCRPPPVWPFLLTSHRDLLGTVLTAFPNGLALVSATPTNALWPKSSLPK